MSMVQCSYEVRSTELPREDGPPLLAVEALANGRLVSASVVEPVQAGQNDGGARWAS